MEDSTYSPDEVGRILKLSRRRVLQLLEAGNLEGGKDDSGRWYAYQWSVHDYRDKRPPKEKPPELAAELIDRLAAVERALGHAEARAELTELAESTIREERDRLLAELEKERQRVDAEHNRAAQERQEREWLLEELKRERERADKLEEVQEESRRIREELDAERSKGFWRRLFGG
jgi:chromosome segregation ATPase